MHRSVELHEFPGNSGGYSMDIPNNNSPRDAKFAAPEAALRHRVNNTAKSDKKRLIIANAA